MDPDLTLNCKHKNNINIKFKVKKIHLLSQFCLSHCNGINVMPVKIHVEHSSNINTNDKGNNWSV